MSARLRAVVLVVVAALAATACGIPTDSSPRRLDDVPFGLVVPPTTVPPNEPTPSGSTYTAQLYYVYATSSRLASVEVDLPLATTSQEQARVVLETLVSGPRDNLPMRSSLRPDGQLSVTVRGSLATVELDRSVQDLSVDEQLLAIGQIVLSLTRVSPIVEVEFTSNGQPVSALLPGLGTADGPVRAQEYFPLLSS